MTGQAPFADKEGIQVGLAHVAEPPPPPAGFRDDLTPAFSAALLSALAKDPTRATPDRARVRRLLAEAVPPSS